MCGEDACGPKRRQGRPDVRETAVRTCDEHGTAWRALPRATQLAALGSVLCLYRHDAAPHAASFLDRRRPQHARTHACIDTVGAREWIAFHDIAPERITPGDIAPGDNVPGDTTGQPACDLRSDACACGGMASPDAMRGDERLRLYLLPDTDFLAWERMSAMLHPAPEETAAAPAMRSLHARLLMRTHARACASPWLAMPLRLHAQAQRGGWRLRASPVALSPLGLRVADGIVRCEGAEFVHVPPPQRAAGDRRTHACANANANANAGVRSEAGTRNNNRIEIPPPPSFFRPTF